MNNVDRAVQGAALAPLSNAEKTRLVLLAKDVYEKVFCPLTPDTRHSFDDWRHQQCMQAVERPGLTSCRHEDYLHLEAHWLRMLGKERAADRREVRAAMQPRQVALWKLRREMEDVRDVIQNPSGYVASIARCRFHTTNLDELSAKNLWGLLFDLRRNAQRRRARVDGVPF